MKRVALIAVALGLGVAAPALAKEPERSVAYVLTPEMKDGVLRALDVEICFRGDASGVTKLDLPDKSKGHDGRWRYLSDLTIEGAKAREDGPAVRVLAHAPGARIVVRYRVHSAYAEDPGAAGGQPFDGAVVRPTWFESLGDFLFAVPDGRDGAPATFRWGRLPKGWAVGSDLEHDAMGRPTTLADIGQSTLIGGKDVKLYRREIKGGVLRVAMRGQWSFPPEKLADDIAETISAERAFWGDVTGPYFVSVTGLRPGGYDTTGGTAEWGGFALYASPGVGEPNLRRIMAHEHIHTWIPFRQGRFPEGQPSLGYWYTEGFTDFYTDRTLLRSGLWTPEDFAAHLNEVLMAYGSSPARNATNREAADGFWSGGPLETLPYQRGYLLALIWDRRLLDATGGKVGLDQVMFAMRDRWAAARDDAKPVVTDSFLDTVKRLTGVDLRPDVERYVERGETIRLPSGLFGECARVADVTMPTWDRGFDGEATGRTGVFTGVVPDGPGYRAGLREGMKVVAKLAGKYGDSRVEVAFRVKDAQGGERTIRYLPEGKDRIIVQDAELVPGSAQTCAQRMSGE